MAVFGGVYCPTIVPTTLYEESASSYRGVDITQQYSTLHSKDMTRESPVTSPALTRRTTDINGHDSVIEQQIIQLKKQQQLQQQILLQHFQAQQQQLAEQHEQQLRQHLKELWEKQQKAAEEQREAREKERLECLKKKGKHEQSAVASSEVKQKLQGFLLNKKQREAAAAAANGTTSQQYRNWSVVQHSPSSEGGPPPGVPNSSPYMINPLLAKYEDDFPLRKTVESGSSNPDSGPNSPPVHATAQLSPPTGHTTPIQEEGEPSYGQSSSRLDQSGSLSDLSLYSSPSMPNISLGRPPNTSTSEGTKLSPVSEAEVRAAFTARLGMPLTGHVLPGTLPFYPTLPVIDGEYSNPTSPGYIQKQMKSLEQQVRPHLPTVYHGTPITDTQVAHARLNRAHRPLGRTQSAPLPLGHPMLNTTAPSSTAMSHIVHYEDTRDYQQQLTTHNLLKQQIRQTVLTRVESRAQSITATQLEHTPEADDNSEVIDLTEKSSRSSEDVEELKRQQKEREILQQQRDLMMRHQAAAGLGPRSCHMARPLSRALSSPLVSLGPEPQVGSNHTSPKLSGSGQVTTTGLAYDSTMLKHSCVCGENGWHPEHSGRLQSVWARLVETGLIHRCVKLRARKATLEEIQTCHSEPHTLLFGTNPLNRQKLDMSKLSQYPIKSFVRLPCGGVGVDSDTTWNELYTAPAARMAVGSVVDLAFKTAAGDIRNGFAVVRPPGHHAEISQAMGFCFFNSVAIATKLLQYKMNVQKILIVDWDVHHGNGTQQIFYDDKRVLFLSLHRHDDGNFFPGTGGPTECGVGAGAGYTVNVAWSGGLNPPMADAEYLAAFRTIVMPIAKEFAPDLVMVSAGFDAATGHPPPLGGYKVSPSCFGYMTQQLMQIADGKLVLALEGGYDLPAICDSAEECVKALLGDDPTPISDEELQRPPNQNAVDTLQKTIAIQLQHWPCLKQLAHTVSCSAISASLNEREESETVTAMASLSMQQQANSHITSSNNCSKESLVEPMEEDEVK